MDLEALRGEGRERAHPVNSDFSLHARAARKSLQVLGYTRCTAAVKLAIRKLRSKDCQGNSPIADKAVV
ncbi:hypothetical protein R5H30_21410 [Sulfitobacter sp. D35]|uniref:hypothetical protein n=1 Tax=Sulfitobacter sp. D35 TaxID=3083252 RepID=UPI00296FD4FB|nr:hypothetical protein [Sulfitobacter sp. D35]MDW4500560.1 hypothetical protein [Sulfitobacter sp. D35]